MANSKAYVAQGQSSADTSTFDITVAAEGSRSPTAAIVFVNYATSLDSNAAHAGISVGMTDFTTTYCYATNSEDGQGTTDSSRKQGAAGNIAEVLTAGTPTLVRGFTVAAITGGIRLTPSAGGSQYRVVVWLFFGTAAYCAMAGDGTGTSGNYVLTHGFTNAPKLGVCASSAIDTNGNQMEIEMGFFTFMSAAIKQRSVTQGSQNAMTDSRVFTREVYTDKVIHGIINAYDGTEYYSNDVTAVNSSTVTIDDDTTTQPADVLWLLFEFDDVDVFLDTVNAPTSAGSDWTYAGAPFIPQFVGGLLTMSDSETTGGAGDGWDDAIGGAFGAVAFDAEGSIFTAGHHDEVDAGSAGSPTTTNAESRVSQALYLHEDDGTVAFDMDNPTLQSAGFEFATADITAANGTVRKLPMIFIQAQAGGSGGGGAVNHMRSMGA